MPIKAAVGRFYAASAIAGLLRGRMTVGLRDQRAFVSIRAIHLMREAVVVWLEHAIREAAKLAKEISAGWDEDELREPSVTRGFTITARPATSDRFNNLLNQT